MNKPLPIVDNLSQPFWKAAHAHELMLPECTRCSTYRTSFEKWCANCGHDEYVWKKLSGRAKVWSHCEFHKAYFPGFEAELPYNAVLVELAEGPRLVTNIVGVDYQRIHIGMDVEVAFDDVTPDVTLIKFRPVAST